MEFQAELPPHVRTLLAGCPQTGTGTRAVHRWLLEVSDHLRHHVRAERAYELISYWISRRPKPREIEEALAKAYGKPISSSAIPNAGLEVANKPSPVRWPPKDPQAIDEVVSSRYDPAEPPLEALRRASQPIPARTEQILCSLFEPQSLLCVGLHEAHSVVIAREKLRQATRFALIVPNPMLAPFVRDERGKRHERCLANTAPQRRFLVLDFDLRGPPFEPLLARWTRYGVSPQMAMAILIAYLAQTGAPLSLVVFSGNHSLQAWFHCQGRSDEALQPWFAGAILLGADPAGWTKCQYFRMPGAQRPETGKLQQVLFFEATNL